VSFDGTLSVITLTDAGVPAGLSDATLAASGGSGAGSASGNAAGGSATPSTSPLASRAAITYLVAADCGAAFGNRTFLCGPGSEGKEIT
jgi:hypothetical protein